MEISNIVLVLVLFGNFLNTKKNRRLICVVNLRRVQCVRFRAYSPLQTLNANLFAIYSARELRKANTGKVHSEASRKLLFFVLKIDTLCTHSNCSRYSFVAQFAMLTAKL